MGEMNKNYILALMASMFFLGLAATDIYITTLPALVRDFNTTPNIVNMTISVYTIGGGVFVLFADLFSCRYGRRPVILISIAVFTLSSFLISISTSIYLIIILRFGQSAIAFVFIVSRQVLKDIMNQREQVRANGIILSGLVVSPAIAPVIGAYLSHHFGWRSCFVFIGIVGLILLFIAFKILPETNSNRLPALPKIGKYTLKYVVLLKNKFFLAITLIYVSATGAFFAFIGISSYLFIDNLGITPINYSYIYILMAVAYLIGNQYMLFLNRAETQYNKIIAIGVFSTFAGALIIFAAKAFVLPVIVVILITLGSMFMRAANALTNPTTQVITINHFKSKGGIALGVAMSINSIMMGIAVTLVTLFHSDPLEGLIIISLLFAIIGLIAFYMVKSKIENEPIK